MLRYKRNLVLDLFDYSGHKKCTLYDNSSDVSGQAYNVIVSTERNGWRELSFTMPTKCDTGNGQEDNYRVSFLKADYKIRLIDDDGTDWFLVSEPKIVHNNYTKTISVKAGHISQLLKTKNLGLEFSDDVGNNVGTAYELLSTILDGTGWEPGYVDTFEEKDGSVKYRSLKASAKTGAFKLIASMCTLFDAKPIYHGDTRTVDIIPINPFSEPEDGSLPDITKADGVTELHYGNNVKNVQRTLNAENIVTRLYAYGAYGDKTSGYCGIDECTHKEYLFVFTSDGADAYTTEGQYSFSYTDETGTTITRYFIAKPGIHTFTYSTLDPASMMYVWTEDIGENGTACPVTKTPVDGMPITPIGSSQEVSDVQNWFSSLMDFDYYSEVGLLDDNMLQTIARYQREAPALLEETADAAAMFAEDLTTLAETVGSVDFCKLDVASVRKVDGQIQITLNKETYPDGVIYRSDYDSAQDKHFKWKIATELKPNGDAINTEASVVYIVHKAQAPSPIEYDVSYIMKMDGEAENKDEPTVLTLWSSDSDLTSTTATDQYFLFGNYSVNGNLGGFEAQIETLISTIESTTTIASVKHPTFFATATNEPDISTKKKRAQLNGYGWWWKYEKGSTNSQFYFCWSDEGDMEWRRVYVGRGNPGEYEGYGYWYDWNDGVLYRLSDDNIWISYSDTKTATNYYGRVQNALAAVYISCLDYDKVRKGVYDDYVYTVSDNEILPIGNYYMRDSYRNYFLFTTTEELSAGDKITYYPLHGWMVQTKDGSELDSVDVVAAKFDALKYHPRYITTKAKYSKGSLKTEDGSEVSDSNYVKSGYLSAYPNCKYYVTNLPNETIKTLYYDSNKRYISCSDSAISGSNGTFTTPGNTSYVRVLYEGNKTDIQGVLQISADSTYIVDGVEHIKKVIHPKSGETYDRLFDLTHSEDALKQGINAAISRFVKVANKAYLTDYATMKAAQEAVTEHENAMKTALGELYREGYWQKSDYIEGDEKKLYEDAIENINKISKPQAKYTIDFLDLYNSNVDEEEHSVNDAAGKIAWPDLNINAAIHLIDPEIEVNTWAYVDKIDKCYDKPWETKITINTDLSTIGQHTFTDVMTHIAEVASQVSAKETIYERAKAITSTGAYAAEMLEGAINASSLLITGGTSNWYTDDKGNVVFVSATGDSAMMLSGAGLVIANSKDEWGDWRWRTAATGDGIVADTITAGYISGERILAGSIQTDQLSSSVGESLDISSNESISLIAGDIEDLTNTVVDIRDNAIEAKVQEIFEEDDEGNSTLSQAVLNIYSDKLEARVKQEINENGTIQNIESWMSFDESGTLSIGQSDEDLRTEFTNSNWRIMKNEDDAVVEIDGDTSTMTITNASIGQSLEINGFKFIPTDTGMALIYSANG